MFHYSLITLLTILITNASGEKINPQLINKNVERIVDITSQLVKITTTITLENGGDTTIRNFLVALEPNTASNLSYITAKDTLKDELKLAQVKVEERTTNDETFYLVELKQPLTKGRTTSVSVETVFFGSLEPYPNSIAQREKQLVRYFGNHYFYSPYTTNKQTTNVLLATRNIENYTKLKPVSQTDLTITYGPYLDLPRFSFDEMVVHYENNAPFLTVQRLERLIEISHWGNIAVEENIEIVHTGAKLKGSFSRYDYQRDTNSVKHSIKSYKTILPASAYNIYYRDSNGNISTSHVKSRKDWIELELRPRFPLFGGWRSSYILGYNVPSYQYLYKKSSSEYVLNMRLIDHVFDDMYVKELETSIVLPVGVTDVKIIPPYEIERLADGVTYKYLDNLGRTIIRLRKTNLVEQHIQDIKISYNWTPFLLFHEPILLSISLYVLFIVVIIYVRLDFSIQKNDTIKKDN